MKLVTIVLALAASAGIVACGGGDSGGGSSSSGSNDDGFTSSGFGEAVDAVAGEAGEDAPVLQIQINTGGTEFQIRDGEQATGFIYSGGDLNPVDVEVVGTGTLEGQDFPLSQVDPAAIDKIVSGVKEQSGIEDIEITVMTLEKQVLDGELKWVVNADGNGRTGLVYNADLDGSNVTSPTGSLPGTDSGLPDTTGTDTTGGTGGSGSGSSDAGGSTGVQDAQAIANCIQQAGSDVAKIQACTQ